MRNFTISWDDFEFIQFVWIAVAISIFFLLLRVTAPYGRHTSANWGPLISNRMGWLLMEIPVLIAFFIFLLPEIKIISTVSWVMIGLFCLHYFNRVFVFPFRLRTPGKKMPLIILLFAVFFNIMNGFSLGYFFGHFANYTNEWFLDIRFMAGTCLFFTGLCINWKADDVLIRLRKSGETNYQIPRGWLFEKISCPNLFGELVEWTGFAILCWNLPAFTFLIWTAANLIPRAIAHHKWYKIKFSEYPKNRKAILPLIV